jgi:hypothetical protein
MNFVVFNIILLVASFLAAAIFAGGVMLCMLPCAPFLKMEKPNKLLAVPVALTCNALLWVFQVSFWVLWAAFCVATSQWFTQKESVTWDWLYWIIGGYWCVSLGHWLFQRESFAVQRAMLGYFWLTLAAFVLFALIPNSAKDFFEWLLTSLGIGHRIGA